MERGEVQASASPNFKLQKDGEMKPYEQIPSITKMKQLFAKTKYQHQHYKATGSYQLFHSSLKS
jgi:hypothetical protein